MGKKLEKAEIYPLSMLGEWLDDIPIGSMIKTNYVDGHLNLEVILPEEYIGGSHD